MNDKLPGALINFRSYLGTMFLPGVIDVTLPDLEFQTTEVGGAGIAGKIDMPMDGQLGPCSATINFRTISEAQATLSQGLQTLTFRGSQMVFNASTGGSESQPVAFTIKGKCKKSGEGKLEAGSTTDSSIELEVIYYKKVINNIVTTEWDKLNSIFRVNGVDILAKVRQDMGMDSVGVGVAVPLRV